MEGNFLRCITFIISFSFWFAFGGTLAQAKEVQLLEFTDSKKTIIFNIGRFDGVERNNFSSIVNKDLVAVAEGKAEKIYDNYSIWYLTKILRPELLKKEATYFILESESQNARFVPKPVDRRLLISHTWGKRGRKQVMKDFKRGYDSRLVQRVDKYTKEEALDPELEAVPAVGDTKPHPQRAYGEWVLKGTKQDISKKRVNALEYEEVVAAPELTDVMEDFEKAKLEERANNYQMEGVERVIKETDRDKTVPDLQAKVREERFAALERERMREARNRKMKISHMERLRGADWSDDMSDDELSDFLSLQGIRSEQIRRHQLLKSWRSATVFCSVGMSVLSSSLPEGGETQPNPHYDFDVGMEYFLEHLSRPLKRFAIGASFFFVSDDYVVDDLYYEYIAYGMGLHLDYYLFHHPAREDTLMPFVGIGTNFGLSTNNGERFFSDGNEIFRGKYQYIDRPIYYVGLKYAWNNGLGVKGTVSYHNINFGLDEIEETSLQDNIPSEMELKDYRVNISLNYAF